MALTPKKLAEFIPLNAPIVFFDGALAAGLYNGIVSLTLHSNLLVPTDTGQTLNRRSVVAYLRGNVQAAESLHDALGKLIAAAKRPAGDFEADRLQSRALPLSPRE